MGQYGYVKLSLSEFLEGGDFFMSENKFYAVSLALSDSRNLEVSG